MEFTVDDETIIKRKLMFDGEGLGDERRINLLQKMIAQWISSTNISPEENQSLFEQIILQLVAIEHAKRKSELIFLTNIRDTERYKELIKDLNKNIADIQEAIKSAKTVLKELKNCKLQKLKYDMLLKDISSEPSRVATLESINQMRSKLSNMKSLNDKLNNQLNVLKKHLFLIAKNSEVLNSRMGSSNFP